MEVRRGDRKFFGGLPPRNCNRDGDGTHNQLRTTGNQCLAVVLCSCHHLKISASATDFGPHRRCSAAEVHFFTQRNWTTIGCFTASRLRKIRHDLRHLTMEPGRVEFNERSKRPWTLCLKRHAQSCPNGGGHESRKFIAEQLIRCARSGNALGVAEQPWVNWVSAGARATSSVPVAPGER